MQGSSLKNESRWPLSKFTESVKKSSGGDPLIEQTVGRSFTPRGKKEMTGRESVYTSYAVGGVACGGS